MRPISTRLPDQPFARGLRAVAAMPRKFLCMATLARQRRALARLELYQLDDLGLSSDAARREAARLPWDAPDHWRQ